MATVNACRAADGQAALTLDQMQAQGIVSYIAFPEALKGKYQSYTEADMSALRGAGYDAPFYSVEEGIARYVEHLLKAMSTYKTLEDFVGNTPLVRLKRMPGVTQQHRSWPSSKATTRPAR